MNKTYKIVMMVLCCGLVMYGCGTKKLAPAETDLSSPASESTTTTAVAVTEPTTEGVPEQVASPLNGLMIDAQRAKSRPLAVMFDNYFSARPQAGLAEADVVYEILVEGSITRYMAIYQSVIPGEIGPVRSARPYFIDFACEYGASYAHVGGSEDAKADLRRLSPKYMYDIEGLYYEGTSYWRKDHKKKPNNMYTSGEALLNVVQAQGVDLAFEVSSLNFGLPNMAGATDKDKVKIVYKAPTTKDSVGYFIEFVYNREAALYQRLVLGKPHIDERTKEQLYAKSIIVQLAPTKVLDSAGRLSVGVIGKGKGYYLCEGKVVPITWEKTVEAGRTQYYDEQGQPLLIEPGKLWIQLVPSDFRLD